MLGLRQIFPGSANALREPTSLHEVRSHVPACGCMPWLLTWRTYATQSAFCLALLRARSACGRSAAKALLCKQRDHFTCQICGINFGALYGALGEGLADAHHLKPLDSQPDRTKTQMKDLITVCPNCHRVLHLPKVGGRVQKVKKAFTRN